jgi:hypothetical protein
MRVGHSLAEVLEEWISGVRGKLPSGLEIARADRFACLVLAGDLQSGVEAEPPDHAIEDDAEGEEKTGENGPHDPAPFDEGFDDDIGEHDTEF